MKITKELAEWVILIGVIGIIYFAGWHTEVIGRIQQVVLSTGLISPDLVNEETEISYNFLLEDLEGNDLPFNDFKGEVVFLNFWATWCPPCIAEMPDIHSLYQKQKEGVHFVMVSLDEDEEKARKFIRKRGFTFPVYFLKSPLPTIFDTHAIPTTYVIDRKGVVKVKNHGMAKYNTERFNQMLTSLSETK